MTEPEWTQHLADADPEWRTLLSPAAGERETAGYGHTVREILQQPATWEHTASLMAWSAGTFAESVESAPAVVLTGSGSSLCAVECAAPAIRLGLGVPVTVVAGGDILTDPEQALPADGLMLSISRSGDSPESYAVINLALSVRPRMKHLVITCNVNGRLATEFRLSDRVRVITLDDRTNDASAIMTSSMTNLVVAAEFLGLLTRAAEYKHRIAVLSRAAATLLETHAGRIAQIARTPFQRAMFLGTGPRLGAAREAALKLLEMTDGGVAAAAESYLGLRHGPMAFIHDGTLVVCFLSSSNPARAYELDLIHELKTKRPGCSKLIVGGEIPAGLADERDCAIEISGADRAPVVHIVAGQLLALFRSLAGGMRPDAPYAGNRMARLVPAFRIHPVS